MCGITGFITREPCDALELHARVKDMADRLVHRGPDDSGTWVDPSAGAALGFRRLAIVDLSPAGHQPMESASGRYVIIFNGEVYNFLELRRELESRNYSFRGHSDTEVMLAAISEWGLEAAVRRFVGMFAFALWDCQDRALHLVRDRLGIKPLYYGWSGKTFLFGSELKSLRANPGFSPEIDRDALTLFFRYQYIPQPYSIYKGIQKLPPGFILTIKPGISSSLEKTSLRAYWSAKDVAERGARDIFAGTEQDATKELDALLREAVRLRMIADVPLGAFLSGGIDSSTVVALMQVQSSRSVKTFTIGFYEDEYNEAQHAKQVAAHLGTDHTELYLSPEQVFDVIPKIPSLYDEPFSDSSQIPTYLVSALARQQVTVSLSGDGGDELFGGYHHYFLGRSIWRGIGWLPYSVRRSLAWMLRQAAPETWNHILKLVAPIFTSRLRTGLRGDRVHKLAEILAARYSEEFYKELVSCWKRPTELVCSGQEPTTVLGDMNEWATLPSFPQRMMFLDLLTYLPDDILTKVDRASMGVSLEARVPLLDHRVVEFAARIPLGMKIRSGKGKWLLRQVLYRYLPKELIERRKMGFGIPLGAWLRGPLREWAEGLLDERQMRQDGYLRPEPIRKLWVDHLAGNDWGYYLWAVLMFQSWLQHWMKGQGERSEAVSQVVLQ
jgi:asparagine synthase (glutamine-hydrolysing)